MRLRRCCRCRTLLPNLPDACALHGTFLSASDGQLRLPPLAWVSATVLTWRDSRLQHQSGVKSSAPLGPGQSIPPARYATAELALHRASTEQPSQCGVLASSDGVGAGRPLEGDRIGTVRRRTDSGLVCRGPRRIDPLPGGFSGLAAIHGSPSPLWRSVHYSVIYMETHSREDSRRRAIVLTRQTVPPGSTIYSRTARWPRNTRGDQALCCHQSQFVLNMNLGVPPNIIFEWCDCWAPVSCGYISSAEAATILISWTTSHRRSTKGGGLHFPRLAKP